MLRITETRASESVALLWGELAELSFAPPQAVAVRPKATKAMVTLWGKRMELLEPSIDVSFVVV